MPIPDYQTVQLPLLRALADGQEHRIRDLYPVLASEFKLTDLEIQTMLPSGQQSVFQNRVGWAKTYLKAAGLLENPVRGRVRITAAGRDLLATNPPAITSGLLKEYPGFKEFFHKSNEADEHE